MKDWLVDTINKHLAEVGPVVCRVTEHKATIGTEKSSYLRFVWVFSYAGDRYCANQNSQESAKGAGGKGARVINCHNFFFTPDRETRRIDHTTTEGTAERKMRQFATPAPFTPAPFRPF